jgi:hypothetical protein
MLRVWSIWVLAPFSREVLKGCTIIRFHFRQQGPECTPVDNGLHAPRNKVGDFSAYITLVVITFLIIVIHDAIDR